ncbi:helix-turn-helix domain-containing protein [Aureimonas phyllosphaerae]|uniref:AraC-like DNA-binding protein n=1 Tax=Aureimonas phyllosphaerae TaxID=1166078 RepID=A0A7W6C041_9HYPH|nr:helix-turn-helix domain-containing protein [Aureimonas phyllosphaerae]MBB3937975.1 AraC-like DNA-binding protein [Aureimonas phyllosphaerae]MBB3961980.1 AraC-like DNA-binding protein [Aureimonas phyllosphaerae]SFF52790.1 transcriptional regulator, AraC family [Aureimonas phyllosphaerae]
MAKSPSTRFEFDSTMFDGDEAFGRYHDLYAGGSDVHRMGPDFRARFEAHRLGSLVLFDRHLNDVAHERTAARVSGDGFSHFTLQLVVSGQMLAEQGGEVQDVRPGEIILFDLTRPQRTTAIDVHLLTFSVPHEIVKRSSLHVEGLHGRILGSAQSGLLGDVMTSMVTRQLSAVSGDPEPVVAIFEAALALALRVEDAAVLRDRNEAAAHERIRFVVEANLTKRELDPAMVAHLAGVSRTVLYDLFKPLGGISRYIVARRAVRLRSLLQRPDRRNTGIGELMREAGFASESHASRSFADVYGMTPGRYREAGGGPEPRDDTVLRPRFDDWLRALN